MGSEIWRGWTLKLELAEKTGGAGGGNRGGMSFCLGHREGEEGPHVFVGAHNHQGLCYQIQQLSASEQQVSCRLNVYMDRHTVK